ncbi:MAG UNVERIFIED_CONTAM: pentapeptide repeat-containing protein [Rickettsiaceae bacterium]|jgi:hypothetical protein
MPQIRIVKFEKAEEAEKQLSACMVFNKTAKPKLSFSEFLAKAELKNKFIGKKSDKDIIVADFSGLQINGVNTNSLEGLDFGNSIFTGTEFTNCNLKNAKLTTNVSMEGCRFLNNCDLSNASIKGDLTGVSIGGGTKISNLDLTDSISVKNLYIDNTCIGDQVKINFSSTEALQNYSPNKPTAKPEMLPEHLELLAPESPPQSLAPQGPEFTSVASLVVSGAKNRRPSITSRWLFFV